jgi:TPR repeat protein
MLSAQTTINKDKVYKKVCAKAAIGDTVAVSILCRQYLNRGESAYFNATLSVLIRAAENGAFEACYVVGNYLFRSSRDSSIKYFTKAAESPTTAMAQRACLTLGDIYMRGLPLDLEGGISPLRDTLKAIYWYKKALAYASTSYLRNYISAKLRFYSSNANQALAYVDSCYHMNWNDFNKNKAAMYSNKHGNDYPFPHKKDAWHEEYEGVRERLLQEIKGRR